MRAATQPIAQLLSEATTLRQAGCFSDALSVLNKALRLEPSNSQAHCQRGNLLLIFGKYSDAIRSFETVLKESPEHVEALTNLGNAFQGIQRFEEAIRCFEKALCLNENSAVIHFNLGNALLSLERYREAINHYDKAILIAPGYAKAYCNKGNALEGLLALEDALKAYNEAISADKNYAEPYNNCGNVLKQLGQFDAALCYYNKAIQCDPVYADAHWNRGLLNLLNGNFIDGWVDYEWRTRRTSNGLRRSSKNTTPFKCDDSLRGKTILLQAEQGLGDTIQFCRYAELLSNLGVQAVIAAPDPLIALLGTATGVSKVISQNESDYPFDHESALLSVPNLFGTTQETIPRNTPYLRADLKKIERWKQILGPKEKTRIGLAWSGNPEHKNDARRSIALENLIPFLPAHLDYTCLQKEVRDVDQKTLKANKLIRDVSAQLHDFTDTAALIACMDLVISVDTSIAHLSGALNATTWVLLTRIPDWRWMLERHDSPWYPSATLYRQIDNTGWSTVFKRLREDLLRL